jgi:hypothetical protein
VNTAVRETSIANWQLEIGNQAGEPVTISYDLNTWDVRFPSNR